VIGSLQIYPVAGSQLALAALVMVPLGAVILTDGIAQLLSSPASAAPWRRLAAWATPSAFAVTVTILILSGYLTEGRFESGSPSGRGRTVTTRCSSVEPDLRRQARPPVPPTDRATATHDVV